MSEPIWNQFLTERDKAVFATSGYGARGGFGKRPALLIIDVELGVLRRPAGADPRIDQALAQFLRRGRLDGAAVHPFAHRQVPREGRARALHDRRAARGQLGCGLLELEEFAQRGGSADDREQSRRQRDRHADRARAAGHRGAQAKTVWLLRHQHGQLPDAAWLRQRHRHRHHHVGLRARHRARCVFASITASRSPRKAASTARRRATPSICAT